MSLFDCAKSGRTEIDWKLYQRTRRMTPTVFAVVGATVFGRFSVPGRLSSSGTDRLPAKTSWLGHRGGAWHPAPGGTCDARRGGRALTGLRQSSLNAASARVGEQVSTPTGSAGRLTTQTVGEGFRRHNSP